MAVDGSTRSSRRCRPGPQATICRGLFDARRDRRGRALVLAELQRAGSVGAEDRGQMREGKSQVAVDWPGSPPTEGGETGAPGKADTAQRKWLSEAPNGWIKEVLAIPTIHACWRRLGVRRLNIKRMGTVATCREEVLACQRTCSGARSAHRPRMKRESLPFRPSGISIPESGGPDVHTRAAKSRLSGGRAPIGSKLLRRTLLRGMMLHQA